MSAAILLNLLQELGISKKIEACGAFYHVFATSLINLCKTMPVQRHRPVTK